MYILGNVAIRHIMRVYDKLCYIIIYMALGRRFTKITVLLYIKRIVIVFGTNLIVKQCPRNTFQKIN